MPSASSPSSDNDPHDNQEHDKYNVGRKECTTTFLCDVITLHIRFALYDSLIGLSVSIIYYNFIMDIF